MSFDIQSDKSIKIFVKVNVITNIKLDYDISLDLNDMNIKKNLNYVFKTKFLDSSLIDVSDRIYSICVEDNYLNIIYIKNDGKKNFRKLLNCLKKFHYVTGKKIIFIADKNHFNSEKLKEFIFFINKKNLNKTQILSKIKKMLLAI